MRVSMKWLRELVPVDLPVEELADRLDLTGTAVEVDRDARRGARRRRHRAGAHARSGIPTPTSCGSRRVDVGAAEPLQIVCGAQNFEAGDKVPVATVGTTLPNGVTIKKAKLRGVESEGMNCSADRARRGRRRVRPAHPAGRRARRRAVRAVARTRRHRARARGHAEPPDCLSMAGVAREVGAVTRTRAPSAGFDARRVGRARRRRGHRRPSTTRRCARATPRASSAASRSVRRRDWLAERVAAAGARPINNIVDVTNYVMFELGQPLHAFDAATLGVARRQASRSSCAPRAGGAISTRSTARTAQLAADTLVIADPSGPVALAGVMGGEATEVSDATVDVLLESACFEPSSDQPHQPPARPDLRGVVPIRARRRPHGVRRRRPTAPRADRRGRGRGGRAGHRRRVPGADRAARARRCASSRTNAILGTALGPHEMADILGRLGLGVADAGDGPARGGRADVPPRPRARDRPRRGGRARLRHGERALDAARPAAGASAG